MKNRIKTIALFGLLFGSIVLLCTLVMAVSLTPGAIIIPALAAVALIFGGKNLAALGIAGAVKVRDDMRVVRTIKSTHTAATTKDTMYIVNGLPMLAHNTALINAENVFVMAGQIEYAKTSAQAWVGGDRIYYDVTNGVFTNVQVATSILAGFAAEPAANPSATGFVILVPKIGQDKTKAVTALTDAAATLTATQLIDKGLFTITPGAGRALTLDTAALLVAGFPGAKVGDTFEFSIVCLAAFAATVTTATGLTLVGNMAVNNQSGTFVALFTNVGSGTEAVSVYRTA